MLGKSNALQIGWRMPLQTSREMLDLRFETNLLPFADRPRAGDRGGPRTLPLRSVRVIVNFRASNPQYITPQIRKIGQG